MSEEVIYNEMWERLGEWVCLHDEHIHFKGWPTDKPLIKLCNQSLRVRANQAWKKLPKEDQECMVAHELGHREYQHYLERYSYINRVLTTFAGQAYKNEIEADRYAAKLVGHERYCKFLRKSRDNVPKDANYALQLADYNHRISALEEGR